jgi:hypothetical protein
MMQAGQHDLVAACGIHCGECELYRAKEEPKIKEYLLARGFAAEKIPCPGCRAITGHCPVIPAVCATYTCINGRGHRFCYECSDFPCPRLNPAADRANILPHNLKVFNLSYIQNHGLDKFLSASSSFRSLYYQGKMAIGSGPQLEAAPEEKP